MARRNVLFKTLTSSGVIHDAACFFCGFVMAPSGVGDPTAGPYDGGAADQGDETKMVFPEREYDGTQKLVFGGLPGVFVRCSTGLYLYISGNCTATVYYSV